MGDPSAARYLLLEVDQPSSHATRRSTLEYRLFGGAYASGWASGTGSGTYNFSGGTNAFAMALGGGVNYKVTSHVSIRIVEMGYLMTRFSTNINSSGNSTAATQNNFRVGAGLEFCVLTALTEQCLGRWEPGLRLGPRDFNVR